MPRANVVGQLVPNAAPGVPVWPWDRHGAVVGRDLCARHPAPSTVVPTHFLRGTEWQDSANATGERADGNPAGG
jgi:hypothetical protein